jgi:heat-inducible transcriptional repressor
MVTKATCPAGEQSNLDSRQKRVLRSVIKEYVHTAKPVGSKALCRRYGIRASSATVRNEMVALEDMGFLVKNHASSGRVPTDQGFRYFVNNLLAERYLDSREKDMVRSFYRSGVMNWEDVLKETSRALSQLSRQVGLIMSPRFEKNILQSMGLASLSQNRIMVVLEFDSGIVEHLVIKNELKLRQSELERISNYLTETGDGKTLLELRGELMRQKREAEKMRDRIVWKAISLSEQIMDEAPELNLYIEGQVNLMEQPEFSDTEKMKEFFRLCEKKKIMIRLLDQVLSSGEIKVIIGKENPMSPMQDYSIIAAAYGEKGKMRGALGVIGPVRLDYGKVISLVKFTSGIISDIMTT